MSRKRPNQSENDVLKALYPDLPTSEDYEQAKPDPQAGAEKELQTLREQVARLEGRLATPAAASKPAQPKQAPQRPDFNAIIAAAPDPAVDPQGYAKYLTELTAMQVEYEKQAYAHEQQAQADYNARVQGLWNNFSAKYKDYAKDSERIEIAAARVVSKAKASGVDVDHYLYETQDKFFDDVVKETDRLFGKAKAASGDVTDDVDEEEDDRSHIPSGGQPASKDGPSKTKQPQSQFGSLGTMLNDWQSKTGFYR